mgnify:FL=1|jgi:hypothetical protein
MVKFSRSIPLLIILLILSVPARANDANWEYQVIILQGVLAGSTLEKQGKGFSLDTRRTQILNELAQDGWEVITVIGAPLTDHAVYMKRKLNR